MTAVTILLVTIGAVILGLTASGGPPKPSPSTARGHSARYAASALPKVITYDGVRPSQTSYFKVKPKEIILSPDAHNVFAGARIGKTFKFKPLTWTKWTSAGATATGNYWNMTSGRPHWVVLHYRVKLTLSKPKPVHGDLLFSHITATYTGKKPSKAKRSWALMRWNHRGYYFWNWSYHAALG